jgi:subfamily B ATP-binding cassette protein HlyB/CyaB
MTGQTSDGNSGPQGLTALVMLLRFHGVGVDPAQIRHQLGTDAVGVPEMLRCAQQLGLKARESKTRWDRLARTPLPGIAVLHDGGFLLLGKASEDKVLVQAPESPRPKLMTRAELEAVWDGRLVLMTRRAKLTDLGRRFDVTWFLGAVHKYRGLLGEVLVPRSFFSFLL